MLKSMHGFDSDQAGFESRLPHVVAVLPSFSCQAWSPPLSKEGVAPVSREGVVGRIESHKAGSVLSPEEVPSKYSLQVLSTLILSDVTTICSVFQKSNLVVK